MKYALSESAGFAEDDVTIHDARGRIAGFGFGTSLMNETTLLMCGPAYTYTLDRGRLFPVLGLRWRFEDDGVLHVMPPFIIHFRYRYTRDVTFGFGIDIHGNRFWFSDEQVSGGRSEVVTLQLTEVQVAADVNWKLMKDVA
jgi:hypothetical protein